MSEKRSEMRVEFPKELMGGVYANTMGVTHTHEEFIMDFLMIAPPSGRVVTRVIVCPGHIKRIIQALQENVSIYEQKFGPIQVAEGPSEKINIQ